MADEFDNTAVETRTLYDVVAPSGEIVGTHEDEGVSQIEAERLETETEAKYAVQSREVVVSDQIPAEGAIVSDGDITVDNLERGKRPPNTVIAEG